jgi:group I intron endonuclease
MKTAGIYRIDLGNNNFYIGSAVNLTSREQQHRTGLAASRHCNLRMQNCWNKYGVFEFTVLEECAKDDLLLREQFYLDQHCDNPKNVNLVSTAGSTLGYKHSAETCAKMSAAHKGVPMSAEHCAKKSAARKGVPLSAETRAKISAAKKGVPLSAEHCAKLSAAKKGVPLSAEHYAKLSAAKKGKPLSAEHRAKMSATIRRNRCER